MILMSAWPRQPTDADIVFARSLEKIFAEYPPSVTKAVTDPMTGMQRNSDYERFPPTVPQIVRELNREMEIFRRKALQHQAKRLTDERQAEEGKAPLNPQKLAYWVNRDPATMPDPVPSRFGSQRRRPTFRPVSEIVAEWEEERQKAKQSTGPPPQSSFMTSEDEDELRKWG